MNALCHLANVASATRKVKAIKGRTTQSCVNSVSRVAKVESIKAAVSPQNSKMNKEDTPPTQKIPPSTEECIVGNHLASSTMQDLLLSDTEDIIVSANRKSQLTGLKQKKSLPIDKINVSTLCLFCNQVGLKGQRKNSKYDICVSLVETRTSRSWRMWKE